MIYNTKMGRQPPRGRRTGSGSYTGAPTGMSTGQSYTGAPGISAQGTPGPASPAAPGGPAPRPFDVRRELDVSTAGRDYDQTITDLDFDAGDYAQQAGYTLSGELDPSNPYSQAALMTQIYQRDKTRAGEDYGTATGRLDRDVGWQREGLTERLGINQRGTLNSLAAQGQLYSGAMQNEQGFNQRQHDLARRDVDTRYGDTRGDLDRDYGRGNADRDLNYNVSSDQLKREFARYMREMARRKRGAGNRRDDTVAYSGLDALERATGGGN